ncbi:hypothetical protein ACLB1G_21750 [Oxalobacteraceae bacterium A2-2]
MIAPLSTLVRAVRYHHARYTFRHAVSRTIQLQYQKRAIERDLRQALAAEEAAAQRMEAALNTTTP